MRTCILSWMRSNFNQIGSLTVELAALEHLKKSPLIFKGSHAKDRCPLGYLFAFSTPPPPPPKKRAKVGWCTKPVYFSLFLHWSQKQNFGVRAFELSTLAQVAGAAGVLPMLIMSIPVIWFLAHRNRVKVGWCQKQVVVFFLYYNQNSKFTGLAFVFSIVPMNM